QIFQQIERCGVEPLQVVEEENERMLLPRKDADESPEDELEATLRVPRRENRDGWLLSYDVLQFGDQIYDQKSVRTQRLTKRVAPDAQIGFGLAEKRTDEALEGLRQRRIRDVALVLIELAGSKETARWDERLVKLVHHRRFADARVSGDEYQFRRRGRDDAVEGSQQCLDFGCSAVQFLGDQ